MLKFTKQKLTEIMDKSTVTVGNFNTSLSEINSKCMKYLGNTMNKLGLYKTYTEYAIKSLVT